MYTYGNITKTKIRTNTSYIGETIEQKIRRIVSNNEPISDGAPLVYTDRKEGVLPGYDIRTDRFEIAVEAMDKVSKTHKAKREQRHETPEQKLAREAKENMAKEAKTETKNDSGAKPVDGTQ